VGACSAGHAALMHTAWQLPLVVAALEVELIVLLGGAGAAAATAAVAVGAAATNQHARARSRARAKREQRRAVAAQDLTVAMQPLAAVDVHPADGAWSPSCSFYLAEAGGAPAWLNVRTRPPAR
jgi:hypothetical protein